MTDDLYLNDASLVNGLKRGDNASQESFVARYGECLRRWVRAHFAEIPIADVDEIIQETFYKTIRSIQRFQTERGIKFSTWVFEIAKNTALDWRRKNAKHNCLVFDPGLIEKEAGPPASTEELGEEGKLMREALSRLDPVERQILEWNANDVSLAEIARDYLHLEEGTVRQKKKRALEKLKKIYSELKNGRTEGRVASW